MTDHQPPFNQGNNHLLAVVVLLLSIVVMGLCVSPSSSPVDPTNADAGHR